MFTAPDTGCRVYHSFAFCCMGLSAGQRLTIHSSRYFTSFHTILSAPVSDLSPSCFEAFPLAWLFLPHSSTLSASPLTLHTSHSLSVHSLSTHSLSLSSLPLSSFPFSSFPLSSFPLVSRFASSPLSLPFTSSHLSPLSSLAPLLAPLLAPSLSGPSPRWPPRYFIRKEKRLMFFRAMPVPRAMARRGSSAMWNGIPVR